MNDKDNTIPDYVAGRLIYYDDNNNPGAPWCIYDGVRVYRFPHRQDAERWAVEEAIDTSGEVADILSYAYYRLASIRASLDRAAELSTTSLKLAIQDAGVKISITMERVDTIMSQLTNK